MPRTLYEKLRYVEGLNARVATAVHTVRDEIYRFMRMPEFSVDFLAEPQTIDVEGYQKHIMRRYEDNPVFDDAIKGTISVTDSLLELARGRTGVWRFLPRRRNEEQTERVERLGELIAEPYELKANGIFRFDNTAAGAIAGAGVYLALTSRIAHSLGADIFFNTTNRLTVEELMASLLIGAYFANPRAIRDLPLEEAKYIDGKIKQFYRESNPKA